MNPKKKVRFNLPDPVQMSFMKEVDIDFGNLYAKLDANIKQGMDEEKLRMHENCSFVTTSVNIAEAMAALRHRSVSAHKHYNRTSGISETNRFKALGVTKK